MRAIAFLFLAVAAVAAPDPVVTDWANPPFTLVAAQVDLTVGQDLTLVSGRYTFQYVEAEDVNHDAHVFIHYPFYASAGTSDWREAVSAADLKLEAGGQTLKPIEASRMEYAALTDFPLVDDAQVFVATFEVPRSIARVRFGATISQVQSNFHYHGDIVAVFTPWLPKIQAHPSLFRPAGHDFTVTVHAMSGYVCHLLTPNATVLENTAGRIAVVSEHRQTVAVAVQAAPAH
jgi:hypothetical protein